MKKLFYMSLFAALMSTSVSCSDSDKEPTPKPVQLNAPELTTSNISDNSFTVVWSAVKHADSYVYTLDSGSDVSTPNLSATFSDVAPGDHKVKIKAVSDDPDLYIESAWAETTVTIEEAMTDALATPELKITGQTGNALVVSWKAVQNAERYVYTINDGEENSTDKLFASFAGLEEGDYTVKVKAVAENFTDSQWAEITTSLVVEKGHLEVTLRPDNLQPQNVIFAKIVTKRAVAIYAGAFDSEMTEEEAIIQLTSGGHALGTPEVAVANALGHDKEFRGLIPGTEYTIAVYARYENGSTNFFSDKIKTASVPDMDPKLAAWIGNYTVTSTDVIRFKGAEGTTSGMPTSYASTGEPMTFDITIRPYAKDTKYVEIIDWCQIKWAAPWPMLAQLTDDGEGLMLLTQGVGYGTQQGYVANVTTFLLLDNEAEDISPATNVPYSFIFYHDEDGTTKSMPLRGTANGSTPFKAYATDVVGKDPIYGTMYFYELPKDIPAGDFTLVKKSNVPTSAPQSRHIMLQR